MSELSVTIYKQIGETPLEALEQFRAGQVAMGRTALAHVPMTYAGRLDPMAEGALLILIGEECKQKEKYLGLDKIYEVEILFGVETDTYDALGIPKIMFSEKENIQPISFLKYIGIFTQEYPPYSSRTIEGAALHTLARSGELPDELPTKKVEIYSIEELERSEILAQELSHVVHRRIALVKGDFRQEEIVKKWHEVLSNSPQLFPVIKIKVSCSSGTYMRSLAHRIGRDCAMGAIALSIKRTEIRDRGLRM
jgi:tRNA pseudouridine55 synthase